MRKDRHAALKFRLAGKSYNEIKQALGIPKGTLSGWFTGLQLSERAEERIKQRVAQGSLRGLLKKNRNQTRLAIERMRSIRSASMAEIKNISRNELKLIGIALYWAEGYKRPIFRNGKERTYHPVALSNSDPELIKIFLRFLREVCDVSDKEIGAQIRIYKHMNENELLTFWRTVTGLPRENFEKTYYGVSISSKRKRPFNRLPYGTISIRVNRTNLFHKILGWIKGVTSI